MSVYYHRVLRGRTRIRTQISLILETERLLWTFEFSTSKTWTWHSTNHPSMTTQTHFLLSICWAAMQPNFSPLSVLCEFWAAFHSVIHVSHAYFILSYTTFEYRIEILKYCELYIKSLVSDMTQNKPNLIEDPPQCLPLEAQ